MTFTLNKAAGVILFILIALASAAVSPTPRTPPQTWVGAEDYPAASLESDAEGATTVVLNVDARGEPTSCSVVATSGDEKLDNRTCELLVQRAKFFPAKSENGQAIASQFSQKVTWRIPREKLISQGFKVTFAVEDGGRLGKCEIVKYDQVDDGLQCDPQMIDAMAAQMLPAPLTSYRSVSLLLAMEVDGPSIAIPRRVEGDRVVISKATADVSAAGIITACKAEVARDWMGRSSDLCTGPITVGEKEFAPDPQGKSRRLAVTLEISGAAR